MSQGDFKRAATDWLILIDERLQVFLFILMGIGLILSSWFLYIGLITGDNWVAVCGILFGSNAIGGGLSHFGRSRRRSFDPGYDPAMDDGYGRPW